MQQQYTDVLSLDNTKHTTSTRLPEKIYRISCFVLLWTIPGKRHRHINAFIFSPREIAKTSSRSVSASKCDIGQTHQSQNITLSFNPISSFFLTITFGIVSKTSFPPVSSFFFQNNVAISGRSVPKRGSVSALLRSPLCTSKWREDADGS